MNRPEPALPACPVSRDITIITPLFHLDARGKKRLLLSDAEVRATDLFTGDGLYVVMVDGESITMRCVGLADGRIAAGHVDPHRPACLWPNALHARSEILGRFVRMGWAAA